MSQESPWLLRDLLLAAFRQPPPTIWQSKSRHGSFRNHFGECIFIQLKFLSSIFLPLGIKSLLYLKKFDLDTIYKSLIQLSVLWNFPQNYFPHSVINLPPDDNKITDH